MMMLGPSGFTTPAEELLRGNSVSFQRRMRPPQGVTAEEFARLIGIAPGTVAKRLTSEMFKLDVNRQAALVAETMRRQIISPICIMLASLIAMHAALDDTGPMRRDRRAPERRTAQVRIVRKAEAVELHA